MRTNYPSPMDMDKPRSVHARQQYALIINELMDEDYHEDVARTWKFSKQLRLKVT